MPQARFAKHPAKGRWRPKRNDPRPVTQVVRDKWYPFGVKRIRRGINNKTRLRKGLRPGTVLVLLTGPYRGRRVIYLKQMEHSGLLLVNGPFSVNGVPLKRVSQRFVIITSTRVNVKGIDVSGVTDEYFKVNKDAQGQKLPEEKKKVQMDLDTALFQRIEKVDMLDKYLKSYFTIVPGLPPHAIKF